MSENSKDTELDRLKYKPIKDTIIIALAAVIVVIVSLSSFLLRPKSVNSHVEIKYQSVLLYDKNDPEKSTAIAFPKEGEKRIEFLKTDGPLYLGEGVDFEFIGESVTFTLTSEKTIRLDYNDVTCPDHTCSRMGEIAYTYTPIVCLPNKIQAMIVVEDFPTWDN